MKGQIHVLICGGGTAGHIYPAVSIIETLKEEKYKDYGIKVSYIGTERGPESKIIPAMKVDFYDIKASGIKLARGIFARSRVYLSFLFSLIVGLMASIRLIRKIKPSVVLGMGGYVCAPVLLAALFMGRKIALHEQNYIPGRLNLFFSRFAWAVFLSFGHSERYFRKNKKTYYIFSGNPVRKAIRDFDIIEPAFDEFGLEKGRFTIIAFGGSLGAKNINVATLGCYERYCTRNDLQFLLICGSRFFEDAKRLLETSRSKGDNLIFNIFPYVEAMERIYSTADLVISRSGANTIAELIETNIPSVLIPYPEAIRDHQTFNAKSLAEKGKAIIIEDKRLDNTVLEKTIDGLLADGRKKYKSMKEKDLRKEVSNAAETITEKIVEGIN